MHFNIAQKGKKTHKPEHTNNTLGKGLAENRVLDTIDAKLRSRKSSRVLSRKKPTVVCPISPAVDEKSVFNLERSEDPILIAAQAIRELEQSQRVWEKDFETWGISWRQCIGALSFDNVRNAALATPRHDSDLDPEIMSLLSLPSTNAQNIKLEKNLESMDSVHAGIADTYNSYTSRAHSSDGSHDLLTTPNVPDLDEYEISIIEDDTRYSALASEILSSKPPSRGELHTYHQLLL